MITGRPTMPAMGDLGTFVRERRRELGLTLEQVAEVAAISGPAISQIERGQTRSLKGTTARSLAKALQVTTDELLDHLAPVPA